MHLFTVVLPVVALFNQKAKLLCRGHKSTRKQLNSFSGNTSPVVWVHCASLGEFEQGRPIIEGIKNKYPEKKIVLTFFSPSGFEVRKNYPLGDLVTYLPADTPQNARWFVETLNPEMSIFVKYEFWPNYFRFLQKRNIPIYSISAIFRQNQFFFQWYGKWFLKSLKAVTKFYVQDDSSAGLLKKAGFKNYVVAGDTRFDRVISIVNSAAEVPVAAKFSESASFVIVAGSTWPSDEDLLIKYINQAHDHVRMIIAPHEVHEANIAQLEEKIQVSSFRYSNAKEVDPARYKVMIVDTIGLLSAIYHYGRVAFIGGGFGKGIHNTLEAATYGMPVVFGPNYQKFKEAHDLIACGGGFSVNGYDALYSVLETFRTADHACSDAGHATRTYVESMQGAADLILKEIS